MGAHILWLLAVALILGAVYLIICDRRETQLEQLRLKKMRGGDMYREIYEKLCYSKKRRLEMLEIREDGILFRYFKPEPWEERFVFTQRGFKKLTEQGLHTLSLLIETDHEELRDRARYRFKRKARTRLNGSRTYVYTFFIHPAYKDAINRAPYYSGKQQEQLTLKRNF